MPRKFLDKLTKIDALIIKRATGNSEQLATTLGISVRTTKEFIAIMRSCGAPIQYNRRYNSYCYTKEGSFNISFVSVQ